MPRDIPVGNGNLLVSFDLDYNIRDIYYPYIGKANHTLGRVSRTGVWVDGHFSWLDSASWTRDLRHTPDTMATQVTTTNQELQLRLVFNDVVDFHRDIFLRRVEVFNLAQHPREVRLFFHFDFYFWEVGRGDSIYYHPDDHVLVAYKDNCYFLMNGSLGDRIGIDSWTTGHKDEQGAGGSWADAEDGLLEEVGVSFGAIDGVIAVHQPHLPPGESSVIYTWLAAAQELEGVRFLDYIVRVRKPQFFITRTMDFWRTWVKKEDTDFHDLPQEVVRLYERSLLVIRTHVDNRGGIIAATDSDLSALAHGQETYSYVWPRDGAYIANALDKAGYAYLASRFYEFCKDVIYHEQGQAGSPPAYQESAYMLHKYSPDRLLAASWMPQMDEEGNRQLPIQEDGTALVLYALWQHYQKFRDIEVIKPIYRPLIVHAANFMEHFREPHTGLPAPSFDLWEDRRGIYSYTAATVWAGLMAAANFAELFGELGLAKEYRQAAAEIKDACATYLYDEREGRFLKQVWVRADGTIERDHTIDASLYGLWYFGMFEPTDPRIERTMQAVMDRLWCPTGVGGLARYEGDQYHWDPTLDEHPEKIPGNPWIICTLWLAQYYIARAQTLEDLQQALPILQWARERALPSGVLAEQLHPLTGRPLSVSPLTWSHATVVATVQEYLQKYEFLQRETRPER
ncbi:MAG: glycoside hydrolase family 15 protein [Chloroflexi bacterium]|nr:glycoside hydrolase family 15 protein [Chloroflexota bacterium]